MRVKISDIKMDMRGIEITGEVISVGEIRSVDTRFGPADVAQAVIKDETGSIILNLWRGQIKMIKVGDIVKIENAFVRKFKDRLELNIGKDGKITVLGRYG